MLIKPSDVGVRVAWRGGIERGSGHGIASMFAPARLWMPTGKLHHAFNSFLLRSCRDDLGPLPAEIGTVVLFSSAKP